ncbi:hypothetical protein FHT87_005136 [Rhizobium sp. BK316]|uniref:hypothetical protein n=1 Tax=Rhizobium sp. BK316 TaxID=2587053 RepID=UPI001609B97D|nr:hypothetical protein [Rhizobium sp. BK316]MBB3411183.1 hypothetical protein [Rhizobium sp. BK316]
MMTEAEVKLFELSGDIGSLKSDVKRLLEDGKERSESIHALTQVITELKGTIESLEPRIAKGEEAAEIIDTMRKQGRGWLAGVAVGAAITGGGLVATFGDQVKAFFTALGK